MHVNAQFKSQALGLSLGLATAIGCLAYERLTKALSYTTVGMLAMFAYFPFVCAALYMDNNFRSDIGKFGEHKWAILVYILSGVTGPIWYFLTRNQNVMVGSIYEVKYIVMLAVLYVVAGAKPMTWNIAIGVGFALVSIWFISKS